MIVVLTGTECGLVRSILAHYIGEQGSMFSDPANQERENDLRHKFRLPPVSRCRGFSDNGAPCFLPQHHEGICQSYKEVHGDGNATKGQG